MDNTPIDWDAAEKAIKPAQYLKLEVSVPVEMIFMGLGKVEDGTYGLRNQVQLLEPKTKEKFIYSASYPMFKGIKEAKPTPGDLISMEREVYMDEEKQQERGSLKVLVVKKGFYKPNDSEEINIDDIPFN